MPEQAMWEGQCAMENIYYRQRWKDSFAKLTT